MTNVKKLAESSIKEYGTAVVVDRYRKHSKGLLYESEKVLIDKYFKRRSKILDLACGSGRTALPLYKLGYEVVGVDLTPEMIELAKLAANSENASICYRVGDATSLNFADNDFDGALLSNNGLGSIPGNKDRLKTLHEINRVLKVGGKVILLVPLRNYGPTYIIHWVKTWFKHKILKPFGCVTEGADFGDYFYHRHDGEKKLKQKQYLHFFSEKEVENLIKLSKLSIIKKVFMKNLSIKDVKDMRGSLTSQDNTAKTQIYYILQKMS
jgi:ubiquinone/menaquinone biosynthesis C-methylase UbiE